MKQGQFTLRPPLPLKLLAVAALAALLYGFSPLRSEQAALDQAPLLTTAPTPHSPGANSSAPLGAGAIAVGVATLAASRRR